MKLRDIGEFGFIERISQGCLIRPDNVVKAIGDDAAAFKTAAKQITLVTTDLLVERIHFLRKATSGFSLGYKALAVNLSDIAAMGGTAREAFVSIAVPEDCSIQYLEDIYRGIKSLAAEFDVNILGGDTAHSTVDLILNIAVTGIVSKSEILSRDKARTGDVIFTTGFLGDSRAGLHLILNDIETRSKKHRDLYEAHILPHPCLREGRYLASKKLIHAAIDVSDGLSADLGHIVKQSRVGAAVYAERIPISQNLQSFSQKFHFDPIEFALAGGEDYVLLFTVAASDASRIAHGYQKQFNKPLFAIGEITDSGSIELIDREGNTKPIIPSGWDHFKSY
ncbi:MAG: thiamine-phosphate kinase [Deltaproteobacteria bacterium]|nr:MAG: thiamine-phosphate kinase [Deltaproteobacteria bacterium]